jgi:hypothetical protein
MPRSVLLIHAYDRRGVRKGIGRLPLDRADEDPSFMADPAARKKRRIRFVRGRRYGADGEIVEESVRVFDGNGKLVHSRFIRLDDLELRTIAGARTAMHKLLRSHQEAPPSFRRALVAFTRKQVEKGKAISDVAKELGMPGSTLTRWMLNLKKADL